jgi:hypothetical protein
MTAEEILSEMVKRFEEAGLAAFVVRESTRVRELGDELLVEVVLSDPSRIDEVSELTRRILMDARRDERNYSLVVRAKWEIEEIGALVPARGESGGLRAATLIPITLRSGDAVTSVTVSVTKMAEMELDYILGRKTDLKEVAKIVVDGALRRGGSSAWFPKEEDYLEVASGAAANISRLLKRTA